jgi:hypothetical protein
MEANTNIVSSTQKIMTSVSSSLENIGSAVPSTPIIVVVDDAISSLRPVSLNPVLDLFNKRKRNEVNDDEYRNIRTELAIIKESQDLAMSNGTRYKQPEKIKNYGRKGIDESRLECTQESFMKKYSILTEMIFVLRHID